MIKIRRWILHHLIVIHIFTKTNCSVLCGDRCCFNFYQSSNGDCLECPLGTYGKNCTGKCVEGFYGRLCLSQCNCPAEKCDVRYGCQEENTVKYKDVTYALIGSVTTMSLIGLLFYFKSWFSRQSDSLVPTAGQLYTEPTEHQTDHGYESRRHSSSSEAEHVSRSHDQPDVNNYTDLRFSRTQSPYDNSYDREGGPEPDAPSVDTIPSEKRVDRHDNEMKNDDDDESVLPGKYDRFFKHEQYNVLSLRKPPIEKTMTAKSVDSSTNLDDNTDGMHDEYDSIEMKEKNKKEIKKIKGELSENEVCEESVIVETTKQSPESVQLNRKLDMIVDEETSVLKTKPKSKSFTAREFDHLKNFSSRPYSLVNSSWRKHHTSEMWKLRRISDYEEVLPPQTDDEYKVDELKFSQSKIQSNTEICADQTMTVVSKAKENKNPPKFSNRKDDECQQAYEEIDSFIKVQREKTTDPLDE